MSQSTAALLGAIAGLTIFIGLPIARLKGLSKPAQGFCNAVATGVLVFLLWDILGNGSQPVTAALGHTHTGDWKLFWELVLIFGGGIGFGLLSLVYLNTRLLSRLRSGGDPRALALMIATGLGFHNLSEGLAIGQSAATGAVAFAGVLVIGFALHNVTEGFGIAAPMTTAQQPASWPFLALTGLVGGGPTFVGTVIGYIATSPYLYVLFLALAAGAIIYVLNELFTLGRKLNTPVWMGWGLVTGFLAAFATNLLLTYLAA